MIHINKENYNSFIESGNNYLIYLYDSTPSSQIAISALYTIDKMCGKNFEILLVNSDVEIEICNILSVDRFPTFIRVDKKKIQNKLHGIKKENEILEIMK